MADLDPIVKRAIQQIKPGWDEHSLRRKRFDDAYNIYRVTRAPRAKGAEAWRSDLRVPYGRQVIDTELVNIVQGDPRVKVTPRHPESETGAVAMQHLLDYWVREDHFAEKQPQFVQSGLIFGVAVAKNHWLYRTAKRKQKTYRDNPYDPAVPETGIEEVDVVTDDRPTFEPWNPYLCYWDPGAKDVDTASYVVLQSYISKDDLLKNRWNPDTQRGLYHNVDDLIDTGSPKAPDLSAQARALGLDDTGRYKDKFLIEEIWTDDGLLVLGNQRVLLRAQANPYWHGRKPIVIAQAMPDLFEMEGVSETEAVNDLQQALLTLQNMRFDNLHLTVMRGITYREGGVTDPNDLELRPRFKWPVSDHDDIRAFEVQPLPAEAYSEDNMLMGKIQHVTGVSPYISGGDTQGVDQNTATGITALQEVAGRLLRFKAGMFSRKGYRRTYEMWGDMAQQFFDKTMVTKIVGPGDMEHWVEVQPHDIPGHYEYLLDDTEDSLSKQQERGDAIALLNAFAPLAQVPGLVNLRPVLEKVAKAYGFQHPEELLPPPQPQPPPAAPNLGNQPPQAPQTPSLLGGQTMNPQIAQQILGGS